MTAESIFVAAMNILIVSCAIFIFTKSVELLLNIIYHINRYRVYMKSYPRAPKGQVWRHTA